MVVLRARRHANFQRITIKEPVMRKSLRGPARQNHQQKGRDRFKRRQDNPKNHPQNRAVSMTTGAVLDALNQTICQRATSRADKVFTTATGAAGIHRSNTPNGRPGRASISRSHEPATATTTRARRTQSASSRPRVLTSWGRGYLLGTSHGKG